MYTIIYYKTKRGDDPVKEFILSLDKKTAIKVNAIVELLEREGPNLHRPYADHVKGPLRELRIGFGRSEIRIIHFFIVGRRIVFLHAFLKKKDELKRADIELAEQRMKDWISRCGGE